MATASSSLPNSDSARFWRRLPIVQQPGWDDVGELARVTSRLRERPGLVVPDEIEQLKTHLAAAGRGEAFVLQGGDCAEPFDGPNEQRLEDLLRVLLQMTMVLAYGAGVPVVKIGRVAGQYAKPRSQPTETIGDSTLPSFRGPMVNDAAFSRSARTPDPTRLLRAYDESVAALNSLRALCASNFADIERVHGWNQEFVRSTETGDRFSTIADDIGHALKFMAACGVDISAQAELHRAEFYTSHEALILDYEDALCRNYGARRYATSAHLVWLGDRTRSLGGAHVAWAQSVDNPVAVKLGPTSRPEDVEGLCERLNPHDIPGRLSFITRLGADRCAELLVPLLEAGRGRQLVWLCDPMHANTVTADDGHKTRHVSDIHLELDAFFSTCRAIGVVPAGVHLEITGAAVTECLGGVDGLAEIDLPRRYETTCDPRLNARQSIALAFALVDLLRV